MHVRVCLGLVFLFLLASVLNLPAQEAAPATPAPKPGPQAAEFQRLLSEFRANLAELGVLQLKYAKADQQQRTKIDEQWRQLIEKGDSLEPQLIAAAEKAYAEAPNTDMQVTRLLIGVLADRVFADNYEPALPLARLLLDNQCEDKRISNLAGIAAFALSDYDAAETFLKQSQENKIPVGLKRNPLDGLLVDFLRRPEEYKQAWAKEQQIRKAEAKADDLPRVLLKTNRGDIELELFENEAPNTVANFISLVDGGFYDGLTFHRVLPGFMAQGGCPQGTGSGGPGYDVPCECYQPNYRLHFRGSLSMAHAGRDTGGSQFFLTFLPTSSLDGRHTVFGRVIKGLDVLEKIQRRDPEEPDAPDPDKIIEAKVLRKRDHQYKPKKVGTHPTNPAPT